MENAMSNLNLFLEKSKIDKKEYQLEGIHWCLQRELTIPTHKLPFRGGFICDEMGLGKTIMMIATIVSNYIPRTLVVLPNALLDQWRQEILRTTGHRAIIFHGNTKKDVTLEILEKSTIVLTTYGTVSSTNELLQEVTWGRIIFDEAHHLRNGSNTTRYRACFQLKANIRWMITGTPIQNKQSDLYSLCRLLRIPETMLRNEGLQYIIQQFILKRTKKEVGLLLKDVEETDKEIQWKHQTERQLAMELQRNFMNRENRNILRTILRARQMCVLPSILETKLPEMMDTAEVKNKYPTDVPLGTSKMDAVIHTILTDRDATVGKLIFCHFRKEMDAIAERLLYHNVINIALLDGRVKQKERDKIFSEKYEVLILQIQTCCEGLNLQENYSQIYFVSPNWNPSVEEQAIARCHRYGQEKTVQVFRFYMDESIDKYILSVQKNKQTVAYDTFNVTDTIA
jgi:SNF2 family DNA or RNA helicase